MNHKSDTNISESQRQESFGFWVTLGILFGIIVLWNLLQSATLSSCVHFMGFSKVYDSSTENTGLILSVVYLVPGIIVLCVLVSISKLKGYSLKAYFAFRKTPLAKSVTWIASFALIAFATDWFCHETGRLLGPEMLYKAVARGRFLYLLWFSVVIAAPIAEEIIFRGFAYQGMKNTKYGTTLAIVMTSMIWALIHAMQYDVVLVVLIFLAGIIMGIARMRLKSIYPTIAMHGAMNFIAMAQITWSVS